MSMGLEPFLAKPARRTEDPAASQLRLGKPAGSLQVLICLVDNLMAVS
jgi:hypothetical protein